MRFLRLSLALPRCLAAYAVMIGALLTFCLMPLAAQEQPALLLSNTQIGAQPDAFGGETPVVRGDLYNYGADAFRNIRLTVDVYDADKALIGEGFGFLVDACGTALLDFALAPERLQSYLAPFELFDGGEVASVDVRIDADAVDYQPSPVPELPAVTAIAGAEVVMLEWEDDDTLLYGVGCAGDVFTELEWWRYNAAHHALSLIEHPRAADVTPDMIERSGAAMITQSGEQRPDLFYGSQMTFPPNARRIVYQNDLHSILSAEADGSFKRLIHDKLHQHSLRGFIWAEQPGVFLAYYFGAFGESVHYFTGDVEGKMLMGRLEALAPSLTVPGPASDGLAAVVGRQVDEESGYYWQWAYGGLELLFAAELPGNNYPAPIVRGDVIYVIRPLDGLASLQCFNRDTRELRTISALPLRLTRETRGWSALSPDGSKLALAANGPDGGVWWVDLAGGCG